MITVTIPRRWAPAWWKMVFKHSQHSLRFHLKRLRGNAGYTRCACGGFRSWQRTRAGWTGVAWHTSKCKRVGGRKRG